MTRESVIILKECIELQDKKSRDYQNPNSSIKQADHYRRGVDTIHDMIHQKLLRAQSLLESGEAPNNESLEDTYKDMINYCSFAVAYMRGKMEGQESLSNKVPPELSPFAKRLIDSSRPTVSPSTTSNYSPSILSDDS